VLVTNHNKKRTITDNKTTTALRKATRTMTWDAGDFIILYFLFRVSNQSQRKQRTRLGQTKKKNKKKTDDQ